MLRVHTGLLYLNIWEVEAGGSEVHGDTWLKFKFKVFLSYMRPCFKNQKQSKRQLVSEGVALRD